MHPPPDQELVGGRWPADDTAPSKGRQLVDSWSGKLTHEVLQLARLLVSELISLSIRGDEHGAEVEVSLKLENGRLRVEVLRPAGGFTFPGAEAETADLSLSLVDELADRWGMSRNGSGTVCWIEIDR